MLHEDLTSFPNNRPETLRFIRALLATPCDMRELLTGIVCFGGILNGTQRRYYFTSRGRKENEPRIWHVSGGKTLHGLPEYILISPIELHGFLELYEFGHGRELSVDIQAVHWPKADRLYGIRDFLISAFGELAKKSPAKDILSGELDSERILTLAKSYPRKSTGKSELPESDRIYSKKVFNRIELMTEFDCAQTQLYDFIKSEDNQDLKGRPLILKRKWGLYTYQVASIEIIKTFLKKRPAKK